jgi:hypothetical protein
MSLARSGWARRRFLASLAAGITCPRACGVTYRDDFTVGLTNWVVEQQPGGRVTAEAGRLVIEDVGGATVWYRHRLAAPLTITYRARASSQARVSDLNCFWMARDPRNDEPPFAPTNRRSGRFADYDSLLTYYVGYGGNGNTTTRFRRYDGTGARPLDPQHDLSDPRFLLRPDHDHRIALRMSADGEARFTCDDQTLFRFRDPAPLRAGWFAVRTVRSRLELADFTVRAAD